MDTWAILLLLAAVLSAVYLFLVERVLTVAHPEALPYLPKPVDDETLLRAGESESEVDGLSDLPQHCIDNNIIVIGGAGSVGSNLVKTLVGIGCRSIRIMDLVEPRPEILALEGVEFVKVDICDGAQVLEGFSKPFNLESDTLVVHHTASAIRFWERLAYQWNESYKVNVEGTKNILKAMQLSKHTKKRIMYTSTVAILLRNPRFMRLRKGRCAPISDSTSIPQDCNNNHYHKSKRLAEKLILDANDTHGIHSLSIRPGMAVIGPQDLFLAVYLLSRPNPVWSGKIVQGAIDARDVGRAHIFGDARLADSPIEVGGESWVVTGEREAWNFDLYRRATQVFAGRDLGYVQVPAWLMYVIAHIVEFGFWARFTVLSKVTSKATITPSWAAQFRFFQPALFDTPCFDVVMDDSRARKILGYRNAWTTAQTVKWTVDETEKRRKAGLDLGKASGVALSLKKASEAIGGDMKRA